MTHEALKAMRIEAGLTIQKAAAMVGVSKGTWGRWEGHNTGRQTTIPAGLLELFLIKIGRQS